ncbi:unnamed protein product [Onchocerca flexuosa]|uniref:Transposase n=1 Tax=Onchocerca flexuosa TaxID=387005 RepID=A0A183I8N8_9BILA|nr:unnamed protein product [Onchocerca flexuosa]
MQVKSNSRTFAYGNPSKDRMNGRGVVAFCKLRHLQSSLHDARIAERFALFR